jgi:hypothetical protein
MHASSKSTIRELPSAAPVSRKQTLAGGYALDTSGFPPLPSGRTGTNGDLLKPEMSDAKYEAYRLYFDLGHMLVTLGEELHGERHVVADERIKALMLRLDDLRRYNQVLVKQTAIPRVCSRCQSEPTDDPSGDRMCGGCASVSYGRAVVR